MTSLYTQLHSPGIFEKASPLPAVLTSLSEQHKAKSSEAQPSSVLSSPLISTLTSAVSTAATSAAAVPPTHLTRIRETSVMSGVPEAVLLKASLSAHHHHEYVGIACLPIDSSRRRHTEVLRDRIGPRADGVIHMLPVLQNPPRIDKGGDGGGGSGVRGAGRLSALGGSSLHIGRRRQRSGMVASTTTTTSAGDAFDTVAAIATGGDSTADGGAVGGAVNNNCVRDKNGEVSKGHNAFSVSEWSQKAQDGSWRCPNVEVVTAELSSPLGALRHSMHSPSNSRLPLSISPSPTHRRVTQTQSLSPSYKRQEAPSPSSRSLGALESSEGSAGSSGGTWDRKRDNSDASSGSGGSGSFKVIDGKLVNLDDGGERHLSVVRGVDGETERWMRRHNLLKTEHFTVKQRQDLLQLFNAIDTDHSRCISVEELADPLLSMGIARNLTEVEHLIHKYASHSGTKGEIDFEDFVRLLKPMVTASAAAQSAEHAKANRPARSVSQSPTRQGSRATFSGGERLTVRRQHRVEPLQMDEKGREGTRSTRSLSEGRAGVLRTRAADRRQPPPGGAVDEHGMSLLLETAAQSTGEAGLHNTVDLQRRQLLMEAVVYAPQRREVEWAKLERAAEEAAADRDPRKEKDVNDRLKAIDWERRELNVVLNSVEAVVNF